MLPDLCIHLAAARSQLCSCFQAEFQGGLYYRSASHHGNCFSRVSDKERVRKNVPRWKLQSVYNLTLEVHLITSVVF